MEYLEIKSFLNSIYPGTSQGWYPNQWSAKPMQYAFIVQDVDKWNEIYRRLKRSGLHSIIRTASGGISTSFKNRANNCYAWDYKTTAFGAVITALLGGYTYVFKVGKAGKTVASGDDDPDIYPDEAFNIFKSKCLEKGVDLDKYKIDNGEEVKKTIEAPLIFMKYHMKEEDKGLMHVNHIDFHNSYPGGLCNKYPEFRPICEPLYEDRKEHPVNKKILNLSIGWMQSFNPERHRYAEWAHLSKAAIDDNNYRVRDIIGRLILAGREVIGANTDGVWYKGEVYHGQGEGTKLGEWSNDHINCLFRSRTDGAYEFVEDGVYTPVVRGCTRLDTIKPDRTTWQWGDIYKSEVYEFTFDEDKGVILYEDTQ